MRRGDRGAVQRLQKRAVPGQITNHDDNTAGFSAYGKHRDAALSWAEQRMPSMTDKILDDKTRTELEAAVYRRLVEHLRSRTDVQNIDMMNLAGFCRNCLSNWMKDAADSQGVAMSKDESREIVYGMPYDEWRKKYQKDASSEQKAAFEKASAKH
jgi:uncharacterized protein